MKPIRSEERRLGSGRVACVVVGEFGGVEESRPVRLQVVDKTAKVVFDRLIRPLGLSIRLWMEGGRQTNFWTK